ncbi:MAG: cation transporter [Deltaproteobacteria bacterium]
MPTTITINGMSCQHCVASVTKALNEIDGITGVKVDLASKTVTYEEEKPVDFEIVKKAISAIGFEVS